MPWTKTPPPSVPFVIDGSTLEDRSVASEMLARSIKLDGIVNSSAGIRASTEVRIDGTGRWKGQRAGKEGDVGEAADKPGQYFGLLDSVLEDALDSYPAKEGVMVYVPDKRAVYIYDGIRFVAF